MQKKQEGGKKGEVSTDEVVDSAMDGSNGHDTHSYDVVLIDVSNVWRCTSAQVCDDRDGREGRGNRGRCEGSRRGQRVRII